MTALALHGILGEGAARCADAPPHALVAAGALTAIVSDAPGGLDSQDGAVAAALAHDALLSAYHAQTTVAPVRLGICFSDSHELCAALEADAGRYAAMLARLEGRSEYGVTLEAAQTEAAPAGRGQADSGRGFLAAKAGQRTAKRARGQQTSDLAQQIAELAVARADGVTLRQARPGRPLALACLLDQRSADALARALDPLAERARGLGLTLALRGPWPPYSFAAEGGAA